MGKIRIQDDLFNYVNKEWLDQAIIPDDRPATGGFNNLRDEVEQTMIREFKSMSESNTYPDKYLEKAVTLFNMVNDVTKRNKDGIKPVNKRLKSIDHIKDIKGLNRNLSSFVKESIALPFRISVDTDMKDTSKHCVMIDVPSIILPDTTFYLDENKKNALLPLWKTMAMNIIKETRLSLEDQVIYVDDAIKFDALIAKLVKSNEEKAEYAKAYNPLRVGRLSSYMKPIKVRKLLKDLFGQVPERVIITEPRYFKAFNEVFNEETFILYKHWAYVVELIDACSLLSEKLRDASSYYRRALTGVKAIPEVNKYAYELASEIYSEPIGLYYGKKYFGEEAKKDIIDLVHSIIDTYKKRVMDSDILELATKEKAVLKLSTMQVKMGYPDKVEEIYSLMDFNKEGSIYEAVGAIMKTKKLYNLSKLYEPTDPSIWPMPGHMVNACYNPFVNDITFPAAILQAPFYSIKQTRSQNLGGIGAVIGHEISHAFDNNGALFDEHGNLSNWWSKNDFAKFKKRTKAMVKEFDGIELPWGVVNGNFIVSENIADNGGMAVTLDIMSHLEGANYEEYFTNWARVWCMKAKEEYLKMLLAVDVHGPAILRANMPPRNFDEWYDTFKVTKKDKMYLAPSKRVVIW